MGWWIDSVTDVFLSQEQRKSLCALIYAVLNKSDFSAVFAY
jgi:hypothetical protein